MLRSLLEFEYFTPHEHHALRIHARPISPLPLSPGLDYVYTETNTGLGAETTVNQTVANLAALWRVYYGQRWAFVLRAIWQITAADGSGTLAANLIGAPAVLGAITVVGQPGDVTSQRTFRLYAGGIRTRRFWLRQTQFTVLAPSTALTTGAGGISPEDQALLAYLSGDQTALVAPNGTPFDTAAFVRARNDLPITQNPPGTSYAQDVVPNLPKPGDLWVDTSAPGPPLPMQVYTPAGAWVAVS